MKHKTTPEEFKELQERMAADSDAFERRCPDGAPCHYACDDYCLREREEQV